MDKEKNLVITPVLMEVFKKLTGAELVLMFDAIIGYWEGNDLPIFDIFDDTGALGYVFDKTVKPELDRQKQVM